MGSVRSTQEEYTGRSKNSSITCAATRHMELAEFSVLFGPPTLQRPRGLRETSPQLRRFLILWLRLIWRRRGNSSRSRRSARPVATALWDAGCQASRVGSWLWLLQRRSRPARCVLRQPFLLNPPPIPLASY